VELALAAYNLQGRAPLSPPSNQAVCICDKKRLAKETIHGEGFQWRYASLSAQPPSDSTLVASALSLDGSRQRVTCSLPREHRDLFSVDAWSGHHSLSVTATAPGVWADGDSDTLAGKIAIVTRGREALVDKAKRAQRSGAIGLVILDSEDRCDGYDQSCSPGATKILGEGWGRLDVQVVWRDIFLPVVLVRQNSTQLFQECLAYVTPPQASVHSEL